MRRHDTTHKNLRISFHSLFAEHAASAAARSADRCMLLLGLLTMYKVAIISQCDIFLIHGKNIRVRRPRAFGVAANDQQYGFWAFQFSILAEFPHLLSIVGTGNRRSSWVVMPFTEIEMPLLPPQTGDPSLDTFCSSFKEPRSTDGVLGRPAECSDNGAIVRGRVIADKDAACFLRI